MQRIGSLVLAAIVVTLSFLTGTSHAGAQSTNAFVFAAIGDVPYRPEDEVKVDRLIAAINKAAPAFTLHVGDVKSGGSPCSDAALKKAFDQLGTFSAPLIYAIGDNEWTDCHRQNAGRFDPRERLAKVRELAFAKPGMSLGKAPMAVETQSRLDARYPKYVENQRFLKNGVMFVVAHVVGSNNGFEPDPKAVEEYFERNAANVAWIDDSFRRARESAAKAVVVVFQANVYDIRQAYPEMPRASGFVDTVRAIERGSKALGKPVLVVHGDNHVLEIEAFKDTSLKPVPNTLRLQLPGDRLVHAVIVTVDPDSPGVFSFRPLIVPENGAF